MTTERPTKKRLREEAERVFGRVRTYSYSVKHDDVSWFKYTATVLLGNFMDTGRSFTELSCNSDVSEEDARAKVITVLESLTTRQVCLPCTRLKKPKKTKAAP